MKPTVCSIQVGTTGFVPPSPSPPLVCTTAQLCLPHLHLWRDWVSSISTRSILFILYSPLWKIILRPSVIFTTIGSRFKTYTLHLFWKLDLSRLILSFHTINNYFYSTTIYFILILIREYWMKYHCPVLNWDSGHYRNSKKSCIW